MSEPSITGKNNLDLRYDVAKSQEQSQSGWQQAGAKLGFDADGDNGHAEKSGFDGIKLSTTEQRVGIPK